MDMGIEIVTVSDDSIDEDEDVMIVDTGPTTNMSSVPSTSSASLSAAIPPASNPITVENKPNDSTEPPKKRKDRSKKKPKTGPTPPNLIINPNKLGFSEYWPPSAWMPRKKHKLMMSWVDAELKKEPFVSMKGAQKKEARTGLIHRWISKLDSRTEKYLKLLDAKKKKNPNNSREILMEKNRAYFIMIYDKDKVLPSPPVVKPVPKSKPAIPPVQGPPKQNFPQKPSAQKPETSKVKEEVKEKVKEEVKETPMPNVESKKKKKNKAKNNKNNANLQPLGEKIPTAKPAYPIMQFVYENGRLVEKTAPYVPPQPPVVEVPQPSCGYSYLGERWWEQPKIPSEQHVAEVLVNKITSAISPAPQPVPVPNNLAKLQMCSAPSTSTGKIPIPVFEDPKEVTEREIALQKKLKEIEMQLKIMERTDQEISKNGWDKEEELRMREEELKQRERELDEMEKRLRMSEESIPRRERSRSRSRERYGSYSKCSSRSDSPASKRNWAFSDYGYSKSTSEEIKIAEREWTRQIEKREESEKTASGYYMRRANPTSPRRIFEDISDDDEEEYRKSSSSHRHHSNTTHRYTPDSERNVIVTVDDVQGINGKNPHRHMKRRAYIVDNPISVVVENESRKRGHSEGKSYDRHRREMTIENISDDDLESGNNERKRHRRSYEHHHHHHSEKYSSRSSYYH